MLLYHPVYFSAREIDCLALLSKHNYYTEIAKEFGVTKKTIEGYFFEIRKKLDYITKTDLIAFAKKYEGILNEK